jgi:DNA excision repair protein ERCC-4
MARKELKIEDLTAVVDTREQTPLNLFPMTEIRAGLQTGDYSLAGLERLIAVERKSPSDFLGCVGQDRERFDRELERIVAYRYRALVIECTYEELRSGSPAVYGRSRVTPQAARGVHVQFVDSRDGAQHFVKAFLWLAAKELWSEASALHTQLRIAT